MLGYRSVYFIVSVLVGVSSSSSVFGQTTWYVDTGSTGPAHNGTTWCRAFLTVQEALSAAGAGDRIRVAQGTYKPDPTGLPNPRNATFRLKSGVSLEGGFAGCGAVNPDARDFVAYKATLSGDLNGNDGPDFANYADNSFHVVTYDDPNATGVLLEGFTILGGNSNGPNGLTNQGGGIHIRNGLVKCLPGGPTIRHCVVEKNWGAHHGAINDHGLSTVIENCTIRDNHSGGEGGGLQIHSGSPTVTNCTFVNNTSAGLGGGAWVGSDRDSTCSGPSTATFTNCVFDGNNADLGGGIYATLGAHPTITGCTFVHNTTGRDGAGLYTNSSDANVSNCLFVENNAGSQGGAVYNVNSNPTFTDCTFRKNTAPLYAGAMRNLSSNPVLTGCVFSKNSTEYNGGAVHNRLSSPTFDRCAFFGNTAALEGGAVFNIEGSNPTLRDSLFTGNGAPQGGAISNVDLSHSRLDHCTLHANTAMLPSGAIDNNFQSTAILTNSMVWNHVGGLSAGLGDTTATYSDIQGGFTGEGNIDAAPLFVDADGPDNIVGTEDDDLRLKRDSPGINVGDPAFVPGLGEQDLSGAPRLVECRVDMGAHESITLQAPGDFNADHAVNLADFSWFQFCAFTPAQHSDWQETCRCVFDFDGNESVDLIDHNMFPWDRQPCDEGDDASCDDGDTCNGEEQCVAHVCQPGTPMKCDDGNLCTDDACAGGVCVQINNSVFCNDNDACTIDDRCSDGTCGGAPLDCDDANVCTTDGCAPATGCRHEPNTAPCEDGNACTSEDICSDAVCVSGLDTLCDDGNPCTDDSCDSSSGCVFTNDDTNSCDDGLYCTAIDSCLSGACTGGTQRDCSFLDAQCAVGVCDESSDSCVAQNVPNGTECDDGQFCTASEQCVGGDCVGSGDRCTIAPNLFCNENTDACEECQAQADCEDNNACTDDSCVGGQCFQFSNNNDCDDGLFCTVDDHCVGGTCIAGKERCTKAPNFSCDETADACVECLSATDCGDDGNVCTDTVCVKGVCQNVDNTASCEDGLDCTIQDECVNGSCTGISRDCEDGFACTIDTCEEPGGCVHTPNDNPCDDGNPCTDDSCDPSSGCVFTNDDTNSCDDGNTCNGDEMCSAGACVDGTVLVCDDKNACTDDTCDSSSGCAFINDDTNVCDDGSVCNGGESCSAGACVDGTALECDDGNACTDDSCESSNGCAFINDDTNICDDGNACTLTDACLSGSCQGVAVDCTLAGDMCHTADCDPAGAEGNCDILIPIPDAPGCEP